MQVFNVFFIEVVSFTQYVCLWSYFILYFLQSYLIISHYVQPLRRSAVIRHSLGKISAQLHTTLCIQLLDSENNDKNNTLPLGKQICFTIAWGCAEILPLFLQHRNKCEFWYFVGFTVIFVLIFLSVFSFSVFSLI